MVPAITYHCNAVSVVYFNNLGKELHVCPFDYTTVAGSGKVWPVNRLTTLVG